MTSRSADIARWRADLQSEVDGMTVYRAMAAGEGDPKLADLYARLADAEGRHAAVWERQLREATAGRGLPRPSWRARLLAAVAHRFGAAFVASTMAGQETKDERMYDDQPEAGAALPRDERSHARLLREIGGGLAGPAIARLEGRHRATGGNALRAAVLGIDDGLVSNFGLVMGVAGAGADTHGLVVAGFAGLLAGALSTRSRARSSASIRRSSVARRTWRPPRRSRCS